jgi:hypothetical protein
MTRMYTCRVCASKPVWHLLTHSRTYRRCFCVTGALWKLLAHCRTSRRRPCATESLCHVDAFQSESQAGQVMWLSVRHSLQRSLTESSDVRTPRWLSVQFQRKVTLYTLFYILFILCILYIRLPKENETVHISLFVFFFNMMLQNELCTLQ